MPGKNEIVAGIRLEGEKEFKQEITSVNKSIAASRSELKKTEVAYEGQANSLKALTEKDKALNKILEEQKKKVELTKQALKNAETGYASKAENVEKLRQALEKQQQKQEQKICNQLQPPLAPAPPLFAGQLFHKICLTASSRVI